MIRARCGHCNNPTGIYNAGCVHRFADAVDALELEEAA